MSWTWEVRRAHYVLVNPSGGGQVRVPRNNLAACLALTGHEKTWGAILECSRQVTCDEAKDLLATLRPFVVPTKRRAKEAKA